MKNCIRPFLKSIAKINNLQSKNHTIYRTFREYGTKINLSTSLYNKQIYQFSQNKPTNSTYEQIKNQGKEFYQNYVSDIIELQKSADWPMVIGNTAEPLIVDFYADWCGPCKKLTPILQERIKKTEGKVKLLKVNIDKCGQIAHQLKITSVPTVFAVFRGQGVDSFQGLPENSKIEQMFQTLNKIVSISQKQDKAYEHLSNGKQFLSQGNFAQAEKCFLQMTEKGVDQQLVALKQVLLTQCYLAQKKIAKFKDQIQRLKKFQSIYQQSPDLKQFYDLIINQGQKISQQSDQNPQITQLKNKIQTNQNDLSSRFDLAQVYKKNELVEECLEQLIEIMKVDKNWQDKKANKYMLEVFKELGNGSALTQKYRKIMQRLLY